MRRRASLTAVLASLALAAPAGATTLSVTVQPPGPGTPVAPKAQDVTFEISNVKAGPNGRPTAALIRFAEELPVQFTSEVARFATCPASAFAKLGPKPPPCPAASQLGTAHFSAYIPSLASSVSTDAGYMYKTAADRFKLWVHVSHLTSDTGASTPLSISFALDGRFAPATATVGPSATLDLSDAVNQGVEARITHLTTAWNVMGTAPARPGTHRSRHRHRRSHHRRRRSHQRHRRSHHPRRHHHRRRHHHQPRTHQVRAASDGQVSPFESTACPQASWTFSAIAYYRDGSSETLTSQVNCGSGSSGPPPPPRPCLPLLPVCVPAGNRGS